MALCLTRGLDPEVAYSAKIEGARVSRGGGARESRLAPETIFTFESLIMVYDTPCTN